MTMPQAFIFCLVSVAFQTSGKCSKGSVPTENLNLEFSWEAANRGKDIIFQDTQKSANVYFITGTAIQKLCFSIYTVRGINMLLTLSYFAS